MIIRSLAFGLSITNLGGERPKNGGGKLNNSFFYNHLYNKNSISGKKKGSFHLPNGILFTFHLQYTNLTNNPLGISLLRHLLKTFNLYNSVLTFTFGGST